MLISRRKITVSAEKYWDYAATAFYMKEIPSVHSGEISRRGLNTIYNTVRSKESNQRSLIAGNLYSASRPICTEKPPRKQLHSESA